MLKKNLPQMTNKKPKRIIIASSIGLLQIAILIPGLFHDISLAYQPFVVLSSSIWIACIAGIFLMKKWGKVCFLLWTIINEGILLIATGNWQITPLLISVAVVAIESSKE